MSSNSYIKGMLVSVKLMSISTRHQHSAINAIKVISVQLKKTKYRKNKFNQQQNE